MKTFYLFRHGLATHSTHGYGDKIITAEILPEGILPIKRMAMFLKTIPSDFQVCSEFIRCRQTAEIVTNIAGKRFMFDGAINEYAPELKEPFNNFQNRVKHFLKDLQQKPFQNIVICTHGAVIAAIKHLIVDGYFREKDLLNFPPCGALLIIEAKTVKQIDFN